ncbi:MAG: hypothetical protein Q8O40_07985 [Chloroflexota bacterium]|nr:hypothetical protein [Chloroflexota bacterium]
MSTDNVTISLPREDLRQWVEQAISRPSLHGSHCPRYTSWGGACTCWVSDARLALEAKEGEPSKSQ